MRPALDVEAMADYVRICPRCGRANPEFENACSACGHFIGMEPAIPQIRSVEAGASSKLASVDADQDVPEEHPSDVTQVQGAAAVDESFYLEHVTSDQIFTIRPGTVMGQAHDTSQAEVQVPVDIDGSEYLHRRHCQFERQEGKWIVIPLNQADCDQEFVNPTYVNKRQVTPGEHQVLNDGDVLRLSGVSFSVRFIR